MNTTNEQPEPLSKEEADKDMFHNTSPRFKKINGFYNDIITDEKKWNYYNGKKLSVKNVEILTDASECYNFIKEFIIKSEKSQTALYSQGLGYLEVNYSHRCCHIVSTFFLGIALYHKRGLKSKIRKELIKFDAFKSYKKKELDRQFSYIWFMISLFHDLGYMYEGKNSIPEDLYNNFKSYNDKVKSVPDFYFNVYEKYYEYRNKKDHGIAGGIVYYSDMCEIRKANKKSNNTYLYWGKNLEEVYHATAWIIIAHNIWFCREGVDDATKIDKYKIKGLEKLILAKDAPHPISFKDYPLFFLFCLIDAIDPIKSTNFLSDIQIAFEKDCTCSKIIIKTNDKNYIKKIKGIDSWLTHIDVKDNNIVEIQIK